MEAIGKVVTAKSSPREGKAPWNEVGIALEGGALFSVGLAPGVELPRNPDGERCIVVFDVDVYQGRPSLRYAGTRPVGAAKAA